MRHDEIIETVAKYFAIESSEMKAKDRRVKVIKPKHISMYLLRKYDNATYELIGSLFGMDHCSVLWAINSVKNQMEVDAKYNRIVKNLSNIVGIKIEDYDKEYNECFMENDCFEAVSQTSEIPCKSEMVLSNYTSPYAHITPIHVGYSNY